jgi:hypothetical protein
MRRAVNPHRSGIGADQAIRHVHESGFAGAVLTQECMQLSAGQRKIGPAQRLHRAESLLDADQL